MTKQSTIGKATLGAATEPKNAEQGNNIHKLIPTSKDNPTPKTVDEILQQVGKLNSLNDDRMKIISHFDRVKNLKFSELGESESITLTNSKNEHYKITNNKLCKAVAELLLKEFSDKLNEVEESIKACAI